MKKILGPALMIILLGLVLAPAVLAVVDAGLVTPTQPGGVATYADLPALLAAITNWVLGIIGAVILLVIIYGGVLYAISAGNEERQTAAKKTITYAVVGLVVIILAWVIINGVIKIFVI